jgi:hypothetical protein
MPENKRAETLGSLFSCCISDVSFSKISLTTSASTSLNIQLDHGVTISCFLCIKAGKMKRNEIA